MAPAMAADGDAGKPLALIVAGPTCSGKSALALQIAQSAGGVIINADAMQTYRELRVLTARPTPEEEAQVPHALYGVRPAAQPGNVAWWREAALDAMRDAGEQGKLPILCGGSGMYLASLTQGLAEIPDPGPAARKEARTLLAEYGPAWLHAKLAGADPRTAAGLRPADSQRVARAWEVLAATGRGLADWQAQAGPQTPWRFAAIRLDPPRETLRLAIAERFDEMLRRGAVDEARALWAAGLDPALPAMRAHGVPELGAYLRGELTLPEAALRAVTATGQYTKRQATWFRHHDLAAPGATHIIVSRIDHSTQLPERVSHILHNIIFPRD